MRKLSDLKETKLEIIKKVTPTLIYWINPGLLPKNLSKNKRSKN